MSDDITENPEGQPIATLKTLTGFLDNGTGDPGLQFGDIENTRLIQCLVFTNSEFWVAYPVDVKNIDGWHSDCLMVITVKLVAGDIVYCFVAVDPNGQPVAYHDV